MKSKASIAARLPDLAAMLHANYLKKTDEYFDFLSECYFSGNEAADQLADLMEKSGENRVAFLSLATLCLLNGKKSERLVHEYGEKHGGKFLIALELSLSIFLRGLNSPRGGPALAKVADIKKQLIENTRSSLETVRTRNRQNTLLPNFIDELFLVSGDQVSSEAMTIAIVVDDLSPLKTATLPKMVFDQVAVMLEYTNHKFVIVCSRLHTPYNQFWVPGVHQTRLVPLEEFMAHFDIPAKYKARLSMINLNEMFYSEKAHDKIAVDAFITYPFRHGMLEPVLYAKAPVVEVEIMSGISSATNCDVIVPNGIPADSFLKANFAKTVLVQPPRRRFKGGKGAGYSYLKEVKKFVVSASKDFDKRAELDIDLYLKHVAGFVEEQAEFSWVFVGGSKDFEENVASKYPSLLDSYKMILVGYEQDLPGLFGLAYLYVQPPMIGGGRAPAIAIENGCPALSFQFGDCTRYMPFKCQHKDMESLFSAIDAVADDEAKRAELLSVCSTVIAPTINIEASLNYEVAVRRAKVKYMGRIATQ